MNYTSDAVIHGVSMATKQYTLFNSNYLSAIISGNGCYKIAFEIFLVLIRRFRAYLNRIRKHENNLNNEHEEMTVEFYSNQI